MDMFKKNWKKALDKCKSIKYKNRFDHPHQLSKSRSWPSDFPPNNHEARWKTGSSKGKATPQGCFAVYVGPNRQRFVVSAEHSGHPLFKNLLEDAETVYGHNCQGPLLLPCDVDLFYKVLAEMDSDPTDDILPPAGCGITIPSPRKGYSSLSPSKMLKLNQF